MRFKFLLILLFSVISISVQAAENVIDFEGEVIEGERKRPELFLQLTNTDMDLGDIIYIRENYNDYLASDRYMKPRYFRLKKEPVK
ncbi:hypothetical protein CIK05_11655 [Bdellovibrio sp. qaytius]|nr:hypothetical protein CIK05_11655 [Bdellovibrio sp. qaytius]